MRISDWSSDVCSSDLLTIFDATCPLVTKVHIEVKRYSREGREVVLIGHAGHPEVEGTMGQFDPSNGGLIHLVETPEDVAKLQIRQPDRIAFVTQTTLSMDDTSKRSEEHTSELQSLMRISYAVFCLKK